MLEKVNRMILLLAFYRPLLTEKQRLFMELHYERDLSLGEIAKQFDISRQAVYDHLRRTETLLQDYEEKLGLIKQYHIQQKQLEIILSDLSQVCKMGDCGKAEESLKKIRERLIALKQLMEK